MVTNNRLIQTKTVSFLILQVTSGPHLVSRTGDVGWTKRTRVKEPKGDTQPEPRKGRRFIQTARRWPRKSESAKECVTTHLPNESVPKMDGAQVSRNDYFRYSTNNTPFEVLLSRRTREGYLFLLRSCIRATACGTAFSADLGGSSKYSSSFFLLEDRSGEGFHINSNYIWMSRS